MPGSEKSSSPSGSACRAKRRHAPPPEGNRRFPRHSGTPSLVVKTEEEGSGGTYLNEISAHHLMKYELGLIRACLFDLSRENDKADVTHLKSVALEDVPDEYAPMRNIFKDNLSKKVTGDETKYVGTKGSRRAAVEIVSDKAYKGPRPTAYCNKIIREDVKKEFEAALNCTSERDFRAACAKIANRFALELRYPKGIICFVQFTFQISRKATPRFLAILNTDYRTDVVQYDTTEVLNYLTKAFDDDFRSTIIYPYITEDIQPKKSMISERVENVAALRVDKDQVKIHVRSGSDVQIYHAAGTSPPINIQDKIVKVYEKVGSDIKSLSALETHMKDGYDLAEYTVQVGEDIKFKIGAKEFAEKVKLIVTPHGEGLFIKGSEVKVLLGKHDLFAEGKIRKLDPRELIKHDN